MNNLPEAFLQDLQKNFPKNYDAFLQAYAKNPPTSIKINTNKINTPNHLEPILWHNKGFYLPQRPNFAADPWYHAGAYYPQEAASMALQLVLKQLKFEQQNLLALDLCAAPGGKSIDLIDFVGTNGFLIANEVDKKRAQILVENLTKWGNPNFLVTNAFANQFCQLPFLFDLVLVDAPCSGEGMFRKDFEAVNHWSLTNVNQCNIRQTDILQSAAKIIKPNGYLIYSTCTFNRHENENQVLKLIDSGAFKTVKILFPEQSGVIETHYQNIEAYRFMPGATKSEGLCIIVLQKTSTEVPHLSDRKLKSKPPKNHILYKNTVPFLPNLPLIEFREKLYYLPQNFTTEIQYLLENFAVYCAGISLAQINKKLVLPLPESAFLNKPFLPLFFQHEFTYAEAIKVLALQTPSVQTLEKGWFLASYKKVIFALQKNVGNRVNNYFPVSWKLRKIPETSFALTNIYD